MYLGKRLLSCLVIVLVHLTSVVCYKRFSCYSTSASTSRLFALGGKPRRSGGQPQKGNPGGRVSTAGQPQKGSPGGRVPEGKGKRAPPASSSSTTPPWMVGAPSSAPQKAAAPNFAEQTVWGQNVINVRSFSIDTAKQFEFVGSYRSNAQIPIYPHPEVAFIGRSNVGKSSMLNLLTGLNKNLAVVGKTPGRTQSINLFKCSEKPTGGTPSPICMFVDLPGYGFAKIAKETQAEIGLFIEDYLYKRGALRFVVVLVDSRRYDPPMEQDVQMIQVLEKIGLPYVIVATKVDLLKPAEQEQAAAALRATHCRDEDDGIIPFSSSTGLGKRELWKAIRDGILLSDEGQGGERKAGGGSEDEDDSSEIDYEEDEEDDYDEDVGLLTKKKIK